MRIIILLFSLFIGTCLLNGQDRGWWCHNAIPYDSTFSLMSPNGKYKLTASYDSGYYHITLLKGTRSLSTIPVYYLSELAWSPTSSMFFINQSEGGAVGEWSIRLYKIENDSVKEVDVVKDASKYFLDKMKTWCPDEYPNYVVGGFTNNGKNILVVGVVPNHSSCKGMGNFYGYLVNVQTGKVIKSFSRKSLTTKYNNIIGSCLKN